MKNYKKIIAIIMAIMLVFAMSMFYSMAGAFSVSDYLDPIGGYSVEAGTNNTAINPLSGVQIFELYPAGDYYEVASDSGTSSAYATAYFGSVIYDIEAAISDHHFGSNGYYTSVTNNYLSASNIYY